jgi:hemoglobin-like flavoprotein
MVTEKQIETVQMTWDALMPAAEHAAALFYDRLFQLDPMLRPLFPDDLAEQRRKLTMMIDVTVRSLDEVDNLLPTVQALGRRHAEYGVTDEDYATVGSALLWTLRRCLGEAFTIEAAQAWTDVYQLLARTMKAAAKEAEAVAV